MHVRAMIIGAGLAVALTTAPSASAHVTLNPPEWEADGFARFAIRVPNERDDAATTSISVRFPEQVLSASFEPIEGWRRSVRMARLDEPVEIDGERVTEKIHVVTWSGGRIEPGEFQEFGVSFRMPAEAGAELRFPAVQRYSNGQVVRWIGPADAEQPAPTVAVTAPADEERAAPAATPARSADRAEDDDASLTLSILALIAGVAGLAAGVAALLLRRPGGGRRSDMAAR